MKWKVVSYIDLKPTRDLWKQTKEHQKKVVIACNEVQNQSWFHLSDCNIFDQYVPSKNRYIDHLKDLIIEFLGK